MKKLLFGLFVFGFLFVGINSANAVPIYLDLNDVGVVGNDFGDDDGITGTFGQFGFTSNTTTVQYTDGTFSDRGSIELDVLKFLNGDDEGLQTAYELTGAWTGLDGFITGSVDLGTKTFQDTEYIAGTIIELYVDDAVDADFGYQDPTTAGIKLGYDDDTGFTNGTKIAEITVTSGSGTNTFENGVFTQGSSKIFGNFTWMESGVWYDANGNDLWEDFTVVLGWEVFADVDQNTDNVFVDFTNAGISQNGKEISFEVHSDHDGSILVNVVPEPTTMALFGLGLLSIAGVARRRV